MRTKHEVIVSDCLLLVEVCKHILENADPRTLAAVYVDVLFEMPMEKVVADINLSETPTVDFIDGEDNTNCGRFYHWTDSVFIIDSMLLSEKPLAINRALCLSTDPT